MTKSFIFALLIANVLTACERPETSTSGAQSSPEEAIAEFYANPGAEDTLMDPLIVAGPAVYPLVIEAVNDPDMPKRRYAIGFLGNEEVSEALPTLLAIIEDDSELSYFRGDALVAVYKIDKPKAKRLAQQYQDAGEMLGRSAEDVLTDANYLRERRRLEKALRRWHD